MNLGNRYSVSEEDPSYPHVKSICAKHNIAITELQVITGSFGKQIYLINQEYLLRTSTRPMVREQENFRRIAALPAVPKLQGCGQSEDADPQHYYTLLTRLPGQDFVDCYAETTVAQQEELGRAVAHFLDRLHSYTGAHYDIGLYIPVIPHFTGTWRAGHAAYWQQLQRQCSQRTWQPESGGTIARAFQFLEKNAAALDFQAGPTLLHNDLHPQNILLNGGNFSGVIDWECAQFGEADFELCHLIHWTRYPPQPQLDFRPCLQALLAAAPRCTQVPALSTRLTTYQIEHEIQQILWQGHTAEAIRVPRIQQWLEDGVDLD
ncbi:MAG: aminoglycoside phosphotransferase family protein [Caldilineaceae bacterium]